MLANMDAKVYRNVAHIRGKKGTISAGSSNNIDSSHLQDPNVVLNFWNPWLLEPLPLTRVCSQFSTLEVEPFLHLQKLTHAANVAKIRVSVFGVEEQMVKLINHNSILGDTPSFLHCSQIAKFFRVSGTVALTKHAPRAAVGRRP